MLPLGKVISCLRISFYCYADDTQLYMKTDTLIFIINIIINNSTYTCCLSEDKGVDESSLSSAEQLKNRSHPHWIPSSDQNIYHNLHYILWPGLFHNLRNIARNRPTLTLHDAEKLIYALVSSRLDYCNYLLIGIPCESI